MDDQVYILDEINTACIAFDKVNPGKSPERMIISQEGWRYLNSLAYSPNYTKEFRESDRYEPFIIEERRLIKLGYTQTERGLIRENGYCFGMRIYIDPVPTAPRVRIE